jgi:hypothetical protein
MAQIDRRRRFIFRGNAAAIGGRIVHPENVILDSPVSCSLTVAGGRTGATGEKLQFGTSVSVDRAEVSAVGLFDDVAQHLALTHREITADAATTTTQVFADVQGVQVGVNPILRVRHLRGAIEGHSPRGSGAPAIPVLTGIVIEGVEIGGCALKVTPVSSFFQEHDTHAKVLSAADDPDGHPGALHHLLLRSEIHGAAVPAKGRLIESGGIIYGTVVAKVEWADPKNEYPGSKITDHTVRVPGFGKLVFGEILITDVSRRLTMLRLELGSPEQGDVALAEVETNGVWS